MENKIKQKRDLQLRKIGHQYIIVDVSSEMVNMTNVYSLNKTAAQLWEQLCEGLTAPEDLALWLSRKYGIKLDMARKDVDKQVAEWLDFGLIVRQ